MQAKKYSDYHRVSAGKNGLNMMLELNNHVVGANLFAKKNYLSTSNVYWPASHYSWLKPLPLDFHQLG